MDVMSTTSFLPISSSLLKSRFTELVYCFHCMFPFAFLESVLSNILGKSQVSDNRGFGHSIDRLTVLWLHCFSPITENH